MKNVYSKKRYWYHLSNRLKRKNEFVLKPWGEEKAENRECADLEGKRITVSPSISQCLTALPFNLDWWRIYRTKNKVFAYEPEHVFDSDITHEGWIFKPTKFIYFGAVNLLEIDDDLNSGNGEYSGFWPENAACNGWKPDSRKALKKWIELMPTIEKYIII